MSRLLAALCAALLMLAAPAWAGPVDWYEVAQGPEGRQWWDG